MVVPLSINERIKLVAEFLFKIIDNVDAIKSATDSFEEFVKALVSHSSRLGMMLLSGRLDDAVFYALSRSKLGGIRGIDIVEFPTIDNLLAYVRTEKEKVSKDALAWACIVWFILKKVLPKLGCTNPCSGFAFLADIDSILREELKRSVYLYLDTFVRVLKSYLV